MSELKDVLEDVQKEVKSFGDNIKGLKESTEKSIADVRKLAEEAKTVGDNTQLKADLKALAEGAAAKHQALEDQVKKILEDAVKATARGDDLEKKLNRARLAGGEGGGSEEAEMKGIRDFHKNRLAGLGELKVGTDLSDDKINIEEIKTYVKNYALYLRRDKLGQGVDEKAMSVGSDPDGGYWVTPKISRTVLSTIIESSPLRDMANIETISTDAIEFPIDDDEAGANWVGETETRPATSTPQTGVQRIPVHEMYAFPMVTQKLLEDASVDVEAWLARKVGDKFGRLEATAFVSGNGIKKPRGILTYPNGTTRGNIEQIASGHATQLTADGLMRLTFSIKDNYGGRAQWLARRASIGEIMLFKDGNGQYIWRSAFEAGKPSTLLGYALRQAADMPAIGAGTLPIAFGDFQRAYTIVDRLGITTLRDPYTAKPFVGFYTRKRVGGDVTNFEAIKLQVVSA